MSSHKDVYEKREKNEIAKQRRLAEEENVIIAYKSEAEH